ncbi:endonuclease V [Halorubrum sp. CBA1125]|uniref:endonuclease V n=1 Tax=Halorubrum sp. CBA1125 TaxID=2668072 RepID=UPI001E55BCB1|nr:endonuclease V [Halorubrum sp. CBA1125]
METLQRDIAATAVFEDDHGLDPAAVAIDEPADLADGLPATRPDAGDPDAPVVVGIDQAFRTTGDGSMAEDGSTADDGGPNGDGTFDEAVSAAVAVRDGAVIEYASAATPLSIPYVPGLLAFREGGPMLAALDALDAEPDLLVCDGSGRIHFREAGVATHVGVLRDVPSVGVAKSLLCGEPAASVDGRPAGWRTPIRADESVETTGTVTDDTPVLGYAFQSRQYPNSRRVNPLYVSPGHRVSPETTVDLVEALCAGYKLPEPTRIADAYADVAKREER